MIPDFAKLGGIKRKFINPPPLNDMMQTTHHWKDIFQELVDDVDLVLEILDARNPIGTHNSTVEDFIEDNHVNVELVLVLNKIDLIPRELISEWYQYFQKKGYKVFSTTARYDGGIVKLKKFLQNLPKNEINDVMIVGYPNTGKSSLIESLGKHKKKIGISSKAGFTRSLMKVKLYPHVFLIDTPGVIPFGETDEVDMALKSCMMADKLDDPLSVVEAIFNLLNVVHFNDYYRLNLSKDAKVDDLLHSLGKKFGMLVKGGKINRDAVQKRIIRDWQENNLKYYVVPPTMDKKEKEKYLKDGRAISFKKNPKKDRKEGKSHKKPVKGPQKGMIPPSLGIRKKDKGKRKKDEEKRQRKKR